MSARPIQHGPFALVSRLAERFGLGGPQGEADAPLDSPFADIRLGAAIAAAFFVGFLGWAAVTPLESGVVARAIVVVAGNRQAVQHPTGGVVGALHVVEGDLVRAGDVVLELHHPELIAQDRALTSQLIEHEARRARLIAEETGADSILPPERWAEMNAEDAAQAAQILARQEAEMAARAATLGTQSEILARRMDQLAERIKGYERERAATQTQRGLIGEEIIAMRSLVTKGLAPLTRMRALERSEAELDGRIGQLSASIAGARQAISETRQELASLRAGRAEDQAVERREVDGRIAEIAPRLAAVTAELDATRLRAPATGRVVGLTAFTVGGVVRAGEPIMEIVPADRELLVEAMVRPEHADDVRPGGEAEVRFTAFQQTGLPKVRGVVERISADRFTDQRSGEGYFRADVRVSARELERLTEGGLVGPDDVKPGLPAEVVILLNKRTALDYLLAPLGQMFWRSFREE